MRRAAKITISLPQELLAVADRLAEERSTTRSGVIADLLERFREERIRELMTEGYLAMAEENRKEAEERFPAAGESVLRSTGWDSASDA